MSRLLHPKTLMAIKDLPLAAKTVIDGFMAGINKSNVKGTGIEFSQYRSYQPGDDLRWLDWKMYARSDRYYIRESEMETSISVKFLIDATSSMNHSDSSITKIEYARYIAASLAYLAHLQGDSIGLYVFKENELFSLISRKEPQHLTRFYYQLEQITPEGKFTNAIHYKHLFTGERKKELLVFISDFYEERTEISDLLHMLSSLRHEIIAFHLMGENELTMNYTGYTTLRDFETGKTVDINSDESKLLYTQRLENYLSSIRMKLLDKQIFYRMINMSQTMDEVLRDFLNQRQKSFL